MTGTNMTGSNTAGRKVDRQDLRDAAEKYKNWGKWGADDETGTLNNISPQDIILRRPHSQRKSVLAGAQF